MRRQVIHTDGAPRALGPYSQAIAAGGWVFLSGQIGVDPSTGELAPGGFAAEARQAIANLGAVLDAAGSGFERVVRVTVYLTDLAAFPALNEVYAEAFGRTKPARATVGVAALPKGAQIEIDAIALRGEAGA